MLNVKRWLQSSLLIMVVLLNSATYASGYIYEKRRVDEQIVHILTVNPSDYQIELVRANNGNGRETVPAIAKRVGAEIALNGGFFKISPDPSQDGMPTGTLIIQGRVYHQKNQMQSLILIKQNKLSIIKSNPTKQTLKNVSMVSGVPLLIEHGKISKNLLMKKSDFYIMPHARTALGIKADGSIVIVVAEHHYQIHDFWETMSKWKQILNKQKVSSVGDEQGFTIVELARLMQMLGCEYAINLDGGGSSTLFIKGQVVNQTIGDIDEGSELRIVRPVSDAIIFKRYGKSSPGEF